MFMVCGRYPKICHHDISALSAQSEIKFWTGGISDVGRSSLGLLALILSFKEAAGPRRGGKDADRA